MAETEGFENQRRAHKADLITPPNSLKEKMGSGGIDESALFKAQYVLESNKTDFRPIATGLIARLNEAVRNIQEGTLSGDMAFAALLYPVIQLKAQGAMFRFPLITEISNILIHFLETAAKVDKGVLEIVNAHKMAISGVIGNNVTGDGDLQGEALKISLTEACDRYRKSKEKI